MRTRTGQARVPFLIGTLTVLFLSTGCGILSNKKNSSPSPNTYLYVAEGDVAQLHLESDGTLTPLSPATVAGPNPWGANSVLVDHSGPYLFASSTIGGSGPDVTNQYVIDSDGTLSPNGTPVVSVGGSLQSSITPNGKFAITSTTVAVGEAQLNTYSIGSSGTLTLADQVSIPEAWSTDPVATDPSGQFIYVLESYGNPDTDFSGASILEYTIAANGMLTPLSPAYVAASDLADSVTVAPNGFLYLPNLDQGSVTVFWIDESTGQLANAGSFATGTGTASSPVSIAFDPTGAYAYVVNSADNSVTQFTVNASTGALTMNGPDVPTGRGPVQVAVDPSGKFAFVTNANDGTISQFVISSTGRLTSNGTFSLGTNSYPYVSGMAFAQR
jgi:6-phosphogluconolactonase